MKTCRTCKAEKKLKSFGRRKANIDGRQSVCRDCKAGRVAERPRAPLAKSKPPWRPRYQKTGATYRERQVA